MRTRDLAWLAGIIEGEGSFFAWEPGSRRVGVRVGMSDEDVVRRCQQVAGVGRVSRPTRKTDRKQMWYWQVSTTRDAVALMMMLFPLMGERRQAKIRELLLQWRGVSSVRQAAA